MKVRNSLHRSAAALAVALATFVAMGSGAQATPALPNILNGVADAQALHIHLDLPTVASLQSTLSGILGVPIAALPALPAQVTSLLNLGSGLDEIVSLNHGEVMHGVTNTIDHALGFANPLTGTLDSVLKTLGVNSTSVSSSCAQNSGCTSSNPLPSQIQNGLNITLPAGLGAIKIAGAQSITSNLLDTQNLTGLVDVKLGLSGLLGTGGLLAPVGDAIKQLTDTLNKNVITAVNGALDPIITQLNGVLQTTPLAPVKAELDKLITLNKVINAIPDLTKADLLDLSVLTSGANVVKSAGASGKTGILSTSTSKIANLDILKLGGADGWAHIDAIKLATTAFADGNLADSIATAEQKVTGGSIGGLLGLHVANSDLADLLNGNALTSTLQQVLKQANLPAAPVDLGNTLVGAVKMLYNIAGITVENVVPQIVKNATFASAKAGTLKITVEPKLPVLGSLNLPALGSLGQLTGGALPSLDSVKFASLGVKLSVELPNSSAVSSLGIVSGHQCVSLCSTPHAKTGVGTPFAVAFILIGAAIVVKRYALAK